MCRVRCGWPSERERAALAGRPTSARWALGLVVALVAGVAFALEGCHARAQSSPADADAAVSAVVPAQATSARATRHAVPQPAAARASFIVLLDAPVDTIDAAIASPSLRMPGLPVDAVTAERRAASDVSLPHPEALPTVAPTLTDADRARVRTAAWAVLVDARVDLRRSVAKDTEASALAPRDALRPALFAVSAVVRACASAAPLVYDVDGRRVVAAAEIFQREDAAQAAGDEDALLADQLYIHRYDDPSGTRLLTLNMRAFGLPDLSIDGADPADAAALATTLAHAARALARAAFDARSSDGGGPAAPLLVDEIPIDLAPSPRQSDDPDNTAYRLLPLSAGEPLGPAARARLLLPAGAAADEARPLSTDPAVLAASRRARVSFPTARARWRKSPGATLDVLVPFRSAATSTTPAVTEWMWMAVAVADDRTGALRGRLLNEAARLPGLTAFSDVTSDGREIFDWTLRLPDGGVSGGETLDLLQKAR